MKKYVIAAFVFSMLFGTAAARADVVLNETDGPYNPTGFTRTIASGATGNADTFHFFMAAFNVSMTIDLTDAGGVVQDTIFSPARDVPFEPGKNHNDAFDFAGIDSGNATIAQPAWRVPRLHAW